METLRQQRFDLVAVREHRRLRVSGVEGRAGKDAALQLRELEAGRFVFLQRVQVIEARLSHLAYAQEIASAMLQRQQAEANAPKPSPTNTRSSP